MVLFLAGLPTQPRIGHHGELEHAGRNIAGRSPMRRTDLEAGATAMHKMLEHDSSCPSLAHNPSSLQLSVSTGCAILY